MQELLCFSDLFSTRIDVGVRSKPLVSSQNKLVSPHRTKSTTTSHLKARAPQASQDMAGHARGAGLHDVAADYMPWVS